MTSGGSRQPLGQPCRDSAAAGQGRLGVVVPPAFFLLQQIGQRQAGLAGEGRGREDVAEGEPQRAREDFPWFWGWDPDNKDDQKDFGGRGKEPDGNRWNDLHYTRAFKQAARDRRKHQ